MQNENGSFKLTRNGITTSRTHEPEAHTYQEQFKRLERSYKRLEDICNGRADDTNPDRQRDDMYVFFLNCHHLKDWFKNDPGFCGREAVEGYINNNRALRLCADICNAHKHLKLKQNIRSKENPRLGSQRTESTLTATAVTTEVRFTIDTDSGSMDAFELATECLNLWKTFIVQHGGIA